MNLETNDVHLLKQYLSEYMSKYVDVHSIIMFTKILSTTDDALKHLQKYSFRYLWE